MIDDEEYEYEYVPEDEPKVLTLEEFFNGVDPVEIGGKDENEKYCNWISSKGNYTAAIEVEIVKSMQSGVYKIQIMNDQYTVVPQKISSDELYLLPDSLSDTLLKEINKFWERKDVFKKYNLIHKRGMLLEGRAGMGKTSVITLLIKDLLQKDGIIFLINSAADFSYLYDFLKNTVRKIEPSRPIITVIEDIDKLVNNSALIPQVLDFLDGKMSIEHHLVIMTTNDSSNLPDALLRPSRIDIRTVIDCPSEEARRKFFSLKGVSEEDLDKFTEHSEDLSISQLKELFIGTYVLGNDFEEVVHQIKNPLDKQEYTSDFGSRTTIGLK